MFVQYDPNKNNDFLKKKKQNKHIQKKGIYKEKNQKIKKQKINNLWIKPKSDQNKKKQKIFRGKG